MKDLFSIFLGILSFISFMKGILPRFLLNFVLHLPKQKNDSPSIILVGKPFHNVAGDSPLPL
jgi:hypothetical protein